MSQAAVPVNTLQSGQLSESLWGYFPLSESMCPSRASGMPVTPCPSGLIGTVCHVQAHLVL